MKKAIYYLLEDLFDRVYQFIAIQNMSDINYLIGD